MTHRMPPYRREPCVSVLWCAVAALCLCVQPAAQPAPLLEVSADRPLLIFAGPEGAFDPLTQANNTIGAWTMLPDELKPYAVIELRHEAADPGARHAWFLTLLSRMQEADVPVVVRIATGDPAAWYPITFAEQLLNEFACVQGVVAEGLRFDRYERIGGGEEFGAPPEARWLERLIEITSAAGKRAIISLDGVHWPRVMANTQSRGLYEALIRHRQSVLPTAWIRDGHTLTQISALLGMWIEGACEQWGIAPSSEWFARAAFIEPGVFGVPPEPITMPPAYYRAMVLNGAMTGAAVYRFPVGRDLWFSEDTATWDDGIHPVLTRLLQDGLIARREFVMRKIRTAYQLGPAASSEEFRLNLRDICPILDEGLLIRAAYGVERAVQVPELIPNTSDHYWVPILSPRAPGEVRERLAHVVTPATMTSIDGWREVLRQHARPDSSGEAFVARVGRAVFILHTRENLYEQQPFRIPELPAPVRGFQVQRVDEGARVTWPFREGDITWSVWRRDAGQDRFELLRSFIDERQYLDTEYEDGMSVVYAVTALTSETEPYEDTVNFGDYRILSAVESRIAEEAAISPLIPQAISRPIAEGQRESPESQNWWPGGPEVESTYRTVAESLAALIVEWDEAVRREDLGAVMSIYSEDYTDPQGWGAEYARRAYQWFFERYDFCRMDRQIRRWDFDRFEEHGQVNVLLYCRFTGTARYGRAADERIAFPRTADRQIWLTFSNASGPWRLMRTNPALPNFRDLLAHWADPRDPLPPGPDVYGR